MTDEPFVYDENLLSSCATSLENRSDIVGAIPLICSRLFQLHARHYGRSFEEPVDDSRIQSFLDNVLLVYNHNSRRRSLLNKREQHSLTLNQFSDGSFLKTSLAPPSISNDAWLDLWNDEDWETQTIVEEGMTVMRLHDENSIQVAANLKSISIDDGANHRHLKDKRDRHFSSQHRPLKAYVSPMVKDYPHLRITQDEDFRSTDNIGTRTSKTRGDSKQHDSFETYLNWASDQNPDGVNIVHEVHDQGTCGACWAFCATGSLEASASRRVAYEAYQKVVQHTGTGAASTNSTAERRILRHSKQQLVVDDATRNQAVMLAQEAEQKAISVADLSVQELVDCDTFGDQGCTGGNPLLAFYFIHRYGLASTREYPYVGHEEACRMDVVARPIATAQSWGILTPNHEDNMERVLRGLGPIAVGFNGADPAFWAYSGGIFEAAKCDQTANHALLIVGYGQEKDKKGNTVKYWIARNSWGAGWGDNGFVRVRRGSGGKGEEGICGIARSPSVALGGVLLPSSGIESELTDVLNEIGNDVDGTERMQTSLIFNYCDLVGLENVRICDRVESFFEYHRILVCCLISFFVCGIMMFPLASDCRKRRRQRRRVVEAAKVARGQTNPTSDESAPLLRHEQPLGLYGSGAQGRGEK